MLRVNSKLHLTLFSALILLLVAPACLADLMCYVCDDCDKVTKETPLLACNADFFNPGGSTEASTVTTTTMSTITTEESTDSTTDTTGNPKTTEMSPTNEPMSTTTEESTTEPSNESTDSTEAPMPTPATAGPPETTPGVPTPPAEDLLVKTTRLLPSFDIDASTPDPASQLVVRQRRAAIDTSVSYHCYTVQQSLNNTMVTNRGCSRVDSQQSVCQELQVQYNDTQLGKCDPCTMNACNSATSSMRSPLLATLLFAIVAVALQRK